MVIISYAFAVIMLTQPEIFRNVPDDVFYDVPSHIFQPKIMGWLMIVSANVKIFGRIINKPKIKLVGLISLNNCWAVTTVSLFYRYLHGSQSATFLLCLAMVLIGIGQAIRGDYGKRRNR